MDYQYSTNGEHLLHAKDAIRFLFDEGYSLSEYSYDEMLNAFLINEYNLSGKSCSDRQLRINEA